MATGRALKVFRTSIGFHDAYVAASSRKAALEAWGSDKDLFARGMAEEVTEEALKAEPLSVPGTIIKRLKGSAAEQIAALPLDKPRAPTRKQASRTEPRPRASPKPDRQALDEAEHRLTVAAKARTSGARALEARGAALAKERQDFETSHDAEVRKLEQARDEAEAEYRRAVKRWAG